MRVNLSNSAKQKEPTHERGVKVNYGAAKRVKYRWRWYLLLILILTPISLIAWSFLKPIVLITGGGIITTDPLELRSPVAAVIGQIKVQRGDVVEANTVLIELIDYDVADRLALLQQQLEMLPRETDLNQIEILKQLDEQVRVARAGLNEQQQFRDSYETFSRSGVVLTHEMAVVLQTVTNARINYEAAKTTRLQVEQEQVQQIAAGIVTQRRQELEFQLAQLKAQQNLLTIQVPNATRIIDLFVKQGQYIQADEPLLVISNLQKPVIFGYLEPRHFEYATVGHKARIKLPNGDRMQAIISEPPQLAQSLPGSLSGPFDGDRPYLRVTLSPSAPLPVGIEGLPVQISYDYLR